MPPENPFALPFLNRDMLRFGQHTLFQIRVDMQADEAAVLNVRGITREGQFTYKATTPADSTISQVLFGVPDIPIMICVEDANRALVQGQAFVTISLIANGEVIQQLCSGYVYTQKALSWPNTYQMDFRPEAGRLQEVTGPDPVAGDTAIITVPLGETWIVRNVVVALTTSSTVANRRVHVYFSQFGSATVEAFPSVDQTASTTILYSAAPYGVMTDESDNGTTLISIPPGIVLGPDSTIIFEPTNQAAGDNFGTPVALVEKYFTTP